MIFKLVIWSKDMNYFVKIFLRDYKRLSNYAEFGVWVTKLQENVALIY